LITEQFAQKRVKTSLSCQTDFKTDAGEENKDMYLHVVEIGENVLTRYAVVFKVIGTFETWLGIKILLQQHCKFMLTFVPTHFCICLI